MAISLVLICFSTSSGGTDMFPLYPSPSGPFWRPQKSHPYTNGGIVYSCYKKAIILQVVLNLECIRKIEEKKKWTTFQRKMKNICYNSKRVHAYLTHSQPQPRHRQWHGEQLSLHLRSQRARENQLSWSRNLSRFCLFGQGSWWRPVKIMGNFIIKTHLFVLAPAEEALMCFLQQCDILTL